MGKITQQQCDSVSGKLATFYDSLPADEQPVLDRLLDLAASGPEVAGFATSAEGNVGASPASKAEQVGYTPVNPCRVALDQGAMFSFSPSTGQVR